MRNLYRTVYSLVLVLSDFAAILSAFILAYVFRVSIDPRPLVEQIPAVQYFEIFLLLLPFWLIIFASLGLYNPQVYRRRLVEFFKTLIGAFIGILFLIGYDFITDDPIFPARLVPIYAFLLSFALVALFRQIVWHGRKLLFRYGVGVERIMVIGTSSATKDLAEQLNAPGNPGQDVVAIAGSQQTVPKDYVGFHFSHLTEALEKIDELNISTIVQAKLYANADRNREIQQAAQQRHIEYKLVLAESDMIAGKSSVELFDIFPVISISPTPLLGWGRVVKRLIDMSISTVAIVILSPIFLMIAAAIKMTDPDGPVLFKQDRMTRFNTTFKLYKFRSMYAAFSGRDPKIVFEELGKPELWGEYQNNRAKVANDPRISKLGLWLRKTSLDELPQLLNVLKGDMSLVGPRAIPRDELEVGFREDSPLLLSVKTGITGLAQVSGRSDIPLEERVELDLYYVRNWSVWLDFKILYLTVGTILQKGRFRMISQLTITSGINLSMSNSQTKSQDLEERTLLFSTDIIKLCKKYQKDIILQPIFKQLIRSTASIGANYAVANNASSKANFRNKIFITKKETTETKNWLKLPKNSVEDSNTLNILIDESSQLLLIFQKKISTIKNGKKAQQ